MRITADHVPTGVKAPTVARDLPRVPSALWVALAVAGVTVAVGADDQGVRSIGVVLACVGAYLLAATARPVPDAALAGRVRELTRERDEWRGIAERLRMEQLASAVAGDAPGARGGAPRPEGGPALDPERVHHGGGRPGRLAAVPAADALEGLDPSAGDDE